MSISDKLKKTQKDLENMKKNRKYKKANKEREAQVQLQAELLKCAGDLEVCRKEFLYAIKEQSKNVRDGEAQGFDVQIQRENLQSAAIGYLLIKDAVYALRTISTYDSVSHAYDLLDAATRKMTGEKPVFFGKGRKEQPERTEYGYLNSATAVDEKANIVSNIMDELISHGDIEKCLEMLKDSSNTLENKPQTVGSGAGANISTGIPKREDLLQDSTQRESIKKMKKTSMTNIAPPSN